MRTETYRRVTTGVEGVGLHTEAEPLETGRPVTTDEVRAPLLDALCEAFGLELEPVPAEDHALV